METSTAGDQQQGQQQQQENLLLSFENPNYQFEKQLKSMDQARIDDHLNSNIEPNVMYEELCRELKIYTDLSGTLRYKLVLAVFSIRLPFSLSRRGNGEYEAEQ